MDDDTQEVAAVGSGMIAASEAPLQAHDPHSHGTGYTREIDDDDHRSLFGDAVAGISAERTRLAAELEVVRTQVSEAIQLRDEIQAQATEAARLRDEATQALHLANRQRDFMTAQGFQVARHRDETMEELGATVEAAGNIDAWADRQWTINRFAAFSAIVLMLLSLPSVITGELAWRWLAGLSTLLGLIGAIYILRMPARECLYTEPPVPDDDA